MSTRHRDRTYVARVQPSVVDHDRQRSDGTRNTQRDDRPLAERLTKVLDLVSVLFRATSPSWDELESRSTRERARRESGKLIAYVSETGERRPLGVPPPPRTISTAVPGLSQAEQTARMNILAELSRVEGVPIASAARMVMDQLIEITELTAAESNDEAPRLEQERREMRIALAKVRLNQTLPEEVRTRRVAELELHIALPQAARLEKQWHRCLDEFAEITRRLRLNHDLTVEAREGRIDEEREGSERALLRKALRARGIRTKRSVDLLRRVPTNAETTRRWEEHCQLIVFERECIEESDDFTESAALETKWRARFPETKLKGPEFHRRLHELLKVRGYELEPLIRKRARGWQGLRLK